MNYYINNNGTLCEIPDEYLMHYGVKGMKWGQRKKPEQSAISANYHRSKAAYRNAKKAFNKAYNRADNRRHQAFSLSAKKRAENDARWEDVFEKGQRLNRSKTAYKQAKETRKEAIKSTHSKLNKKATLGEKLIYNDATRKKAAKYIVDNNMSVAAATKKAKGDAWRNTAVFTAAFGAITVANLYANR